MKLQITLLLAPLVFLACAKVELPPEGPSLTQLEEKIVRGQVTRERPEVGGLSVGCTGTLVAPNVVISAAHCFSYETRDQPGRYGNFEITGNNGAVLRYGIDRYQSFSSELGANDIALARLSQPVPANVAQPAPIAKSAPGAGGPLTVFGYGCTQRNANTDWQKRKASFVQGTSTSHLCPGDSGGPVFDDATGAVLRINSGYMLNAFGTDIFGDVPQNAQRLSAVLRSWAVGQVPEAGQPQVPIGQSQVCGFHKKTERFWTCSADGAAKERCRKGHAPERDVCPGGCKRVGGTAACVAQASASCGAYYAPYTQWTCTADGRHVLRCVDDQLQINRCGGCQPGQAREINTCG
jgi:hypothetical protein